MYNWQYDNWAQFTYNKAVISKQALHLASLYGEVAGVQRAFTHTSLQNETLELMVSEAVKTSAIEGEMLSREDVRSSLMRRLGLSSHHIAADKRANGVAQLMLSVRENVSTPLSENLIQQWHATLFEGDRYIHGGAYRYSEEPMQVISGAIGKEIVHFEAPPSVRVPQEIAQFVAWYNNFETNSNWQEIIIKTAITHIYFESIHPFEDGNGRIGRALVEKCLSESLGVPALISLSQIIEKNRKAYYAAIQQAQSSLVIDDWLVYFADLLIDTFQHTLDVLHFAIQKKHFFDTFASLLNERQTKMVNKMLDAGPEGFQGGMTAKKYMSITQTSKATATRDLQQLVEYGALSPTLAGRSTHYELILGD